MLQSESQPSYTILSEGELEGKELALCGRMHGVSEEKA